MSRRAGRKWRETMKQTNGKAKTMRVQTRFWAYAVSTVVVALMVTACGKKDEGGGAPAIAVVPGAGASCTGCPASTALVASGLGVFLNQYNVKQAELSAQFYGESAAVAAARTSGSMYYNGPVVIGGTMRVIVAKTTGCVVPAGDYALQTLTPGQWQGEQFRNLTVTATGPVTLQLQINYGFVSGATPALVDAVGATFPYRVRSDVYVNSSSGGGICSPLNPYNGQRYPEFYFDL